MSKSMWYSYDKCKVKIADISAIEIKRRDVWKVLIINVKGVAIELFFLTSNKHDMENITNEYNKLFDLLNY